VLHYTYTKFSDLTSRRDRCHCKPTKEDVKRCFMLDFDRAVNSLTYGGFQLMTPDRFPLNVTYDLASKLFFFMLFTSNIISTQRLSRQ